MNDNEQTKDITEQVNHIYAITSRVAERIIGLLSFLQVSDQKYIQSSLGWGGFVIYERRKQFLRRTVNITILRLKSHYLDEDEINIGLLEFQIFLPNKDPRIEILIQIINELLDELFEKLSCNKVIITYSQSKSHPLRQIAVFNK